MPYRGKRHTPTALCLVALIIGCGDGDDGPTSPPPAGSIASIRLQPSSARVMALGDTARFTADALDAEGRIVSGVPFSWSASDPSVAAVDQNGRATAIGHGTAGIIVTAAGKTRQAAFVVDARKQTTIGSAGGQIESTDGLATLSVPANALAADAEVSITSSVDPPQTIALAMTTRYNYELEPHGLEFEQPVTLTWSFGGTSGHLPAGATPEGALLLQWNEDGTAATVLEGSLTPNHDAVEAEITDLSYFTGVYVPTDSDGWAVFKIRWGEPVLRWYIEPPSDFSFSWLTETRVERALRQWESHTSSFRFERTESRSDAQLIFEEAGLIFDLESFACDHGFRIGALAGLTCFDFSTVWFETELDANDDVVIRIASLTLGLFSPSRAFNTILHEIGHALGIAHPWNTEIKPIMYRYNSDETVLAPADIAALHYHYEPAGDFRAHPVRVVGHHYFASVSAGFWHTCGTTSWWDDSGEGKAYCWGWDEFGQLGNLTDPATSTPVPVLGEHSFASVSAGYWHTCGVTTGGQAYCWGENAWGGLGDGTRDNRWTPVPVLGGHRFAEVTAGRSHTCGVTTGGQAYCWGYSSSGQLGDNTRDSRWAPVPVSSDQSFASVSAGNLYTCAVTLGGRLYCWGENASGQLGDGTRDNRWVPVPVLGGHGFASVSAGSEHTCGVTTGGKAYCWGSNSTGQLGNGTAEDQWAPVPVLGQFSFASVSAGVDYTCGVTTGGKAYCWGVNFAGQLGDGTTDNRWAPVPVLGELSFASVSSGRTHNCGVTKEDRAYCWGGIGRGKLGDGTTVQWTYW